MRGIYILHFDYPVKFKKKHLYGNSTHYVGKSVDVKMRIQEHRDGVGSLFTKAAHEQSVAFTGYAFKLPNTNENEKYVTRNVHEMCPHCNGPDVDVTYMPNWTKYLNTCPEQLGGTVQ